MKLITIALLMILLIHKESGEIEVIEHCKVEGNDLVVDFGMGWTINQPMSDYKCITVRVIDEVN